MVWLFSFTQAFGSEQQDDQEHFFEQLLKYTRPRGVSCRDHVMNFEMVLDKAQEHGAQFSITLRSHLLIKTCRLTADEHRYVMQCIAGDLTRYNDLRSALRRLKSHHDSHHHQQYFEEQLNGYEADESSPYDNYQQAWTTEE